MLNRDAVSAWAEQQSVAVRFPPQYTHDPQRSDRNALMAEKPSAFDPRGNPCVDFGRLAELIPQFVLQPRDQDQLSACLCFLRSHAIAYKVRGAAHTSGGQVLIRDGAVIDMSLMSSIISDDPDGERLTVEGGARWLEVALHLQSQGRRPLALTDQLRTTVAGTLSVGGFCDTGHRVGLQVGCVTELGVVTPDGERHQLDHSDELFRFSLAGLGQLGVIATATIRTARHSAVISGRLLRWQSVSAFARDATLISVYGLYDYMRARVVWPPGDGECYVDASVGYFADEVPAVDRALDILSPAIASDFEQVNLLDALSEDVLEDWNYVTPALELVLPLPTGLAWWPELNAKIEAAGIPKHFRRGAGTMVLPCEPRLPLAPLPQSSHCMVLALRPRAGMDVAQALIPALRDIATFSLERGAKIYMMGVENLGLEDLKRQFGSNLTRLMELKNELDPDHLCNRGVLEVAR